MSGNQLFELVRLAILAAMLVGCAWAAAYAYSFEESDDE